jgi:HK97 family phage prohead protease
MSPEVRSNVTEIRARGRKLAGYAAVYGVVAEIRDYSETIAPGAFRHALASNKDILALVDHDTSKLLARRKSGTLRLSEDSRGLSFELDLPNTTLANDLLALAERSDLGGMSFAFVPIDERWDGDHRELRSVDLKEISVVQSWPAYEQTIVQARTRPVLFPRVALGRKFLDSIT